MEGVTVVTSGDSEPRIGRRWLNRLVVAAFLAALALACVSTGVRETGENALLRELEHREVRNALVPFALNDQMAAWVHEAVGATERDKRLDRLIEAVTETSMLGVEYKAGRTGSAVEVFETRTANCLAFTQMFVGMARELDLAAYFVEVSHVENFEREGDLIVISDHVAVGFGPRHAMRLIDFGLREDERGFRVTPISDLTATALYYSNRGAEALRANRLDEAVAWLEDAVRIDPELASAWANLGVAQRRSGRTVQAERSYRQALVVDPGLSSALVNLAVLLRLNGRTEEADDLLLMADARRNRNPFTYIALGDLSLRYGRLDEAERFYSRARRLGPDEAAPAAALGEVLLRRGERKAAEKLLRRAQRLEPDGDRRIDRLVRLLAAS